MEIARGFDTAVAGLWAKAVKVVKLVWAWIRLWYLSPWCPATLAAAMFIRGSINSDESAFWLFLGCGLLYVAVASAIRGPSYTMLVRRDPSARGMFRIRLLMLGLLITLLLLHSEFSVLQMVGSALLAGFLLLSIDGDIV